MPNLRPSNVPAVVAIPPAVTEAAVRLAESLPERIAGAINERRRLVRSFLHHVNAAARCERRRLANKARGWEAAELRAMSKKAGHEQAAAALLPLVQQIIASSEVEREPEPAPAPTLPLFADNEHVDSDGGEVG